MNVTRMWLSSFLSLGVSIDEMTSGEETHKFSKACASDISLIDNIYDVVTILQGDDGSVRFIAEFHWEPNDIEIRQKRLNNDSTRRVLHYSFVVSSEVDISSKEGYKSLKEEYVYVGFPDSWSSSKTIRRRKDIVEGAGPFTITEQHRPRLREKVQPDDPHRRHDVNSPCRIPRDRVLIPI